MRWNQPDFVEAEYLAANPDVAEAVRRGQFPSGLEHFRLFGQREGRQSGRPGHMDRKGKALYALDKRGPGLEIGPSHNPIAPKREGFRVDILDHASADELRGKYRCHGVDISQIEDVDFVWSGQSYADLIGKSACYEWIIASHVIEHVPDLVSFLRQCGDLLTSGGVLSLVIPDKRYCFDHFSPKTTTGDVLDAFADQRIRPTPGQVFDHFANATKRNGDIAWGPSHKGGRYELVHSMGQAKEFWTAASSGADYLDVHCWRFTPASFRLILLDLLALCLVDFSIKQEFDTTGCEFHIALSKGATPTPPQERLACLQRVLQEDG